jgi:hypothetical protein
MFVAIGFFVFHGGLQLIKMAVAARVCLDAEKAAVASRQGKLPQNASDQRCMPTFSGR